MIDTYAVLKQILLELFPLDEIELTMETTLDSLDIDSLDTFNIIYEVEEKFSITVPSDAEPHTIGDLVELIDKVRGEQ